MKDDIPIVIECPECETRYEIPMAIPDGGRKVRCARCSNIWTVQPGDEIRPDLTSAPEDNEVVYRSDEPESPPPPTQEAPPQDEAPPVEPEPEPEPEPEVAGAEEAPAEPELSPDDPGIPPEIAADFDVDNDDLVFAEPGDPPEPEPAAPEPELQEEPEAAAPEPELPAEPPAEADVAESAEPEADRDEVADFYGDQGGEQTLEKPQEPIVIGRSRRRVTIPAGLAAGWAGLVLAVLAVGFLAINQREAVVRAMPGSAWVYASLGMPVNVRGLDFRDVSYSWESDAGRIVLEVHGDIVNITDRDMLVPPVVFALRDDVKKEVYQWEEAVLSEPLGAGASAAFAIRIPTPPKSIKSVQVRFARAR